MTREQKYKAFRALHERPGAFLIPNPWNAGTARILTALGFEALATTSAGYAFSAGRPDSAAELTRNEVLGECEIHCRGNAFYPCRPTCKTGSVDRLNCAPPPFNSRRLSAWSGGPVEDATGDPDDPIYEFQLAVERVAAAARAAHDAQFMLTARAENFLYGRPNLDETIRRLQSFEQAGADVLYATGLPGLEAIREICASVSKPVNVLMGLKGGAFSVEELAALGVKRISLGGSLARAALGAFVRAAREVKDQGTFTYAADALPHAEATGYMARVNTHATSVPGTRVHH